MDIAAILDLVVKGLGVVSTLIAVGSNAAPAIKVITDLVTGAKAGTVTDDQLAATEKVLDDMIDDFDQPIV
jgi:hypothetical protein